MILIDFNHTFIATVMAQLATSQARDVSEDLIRHMVLSSIALYRTKFGREYGEIIFCADHFQCWRKEVFPYYKASRKKQRDSSHVDWKLLFRMMDKIREELIETFPYKFLRIERVEADDIIGTLVAYFQSHELVSNGLCEEPQKILIISGDKDFLQLQKYPNVFQYAPTKRLFLTTDNALMFLREQILRGDTGDGIPNFLSGDSVFVTEGTRQKSLFQKKINEWIKFESPEDFCDDELLRNYKRNELLICLDNTPNDLREKILENYLKDISGDRKYLLNYFVKHRLKNLFERLGDF